MFVESFSKKWIEDFLNKIEDVPQKDNGFPPTCKHSGPTHTDVLKKRHVSKIRYSANKNVGSMGTMTNYHFSIFFRGFPMSFRSQSQLSRPFLFDWLCWIFQ